VGIQGNSTTGLQYSYETPALSSDLAICYAYPGNLPDCRYGDVPWLAVDPASGSVPADGVVTVDVGVSAWPTATSGTVYTATLAVLTGDAMNPRIDVPVTMSVVLPAYRSYLPLVRRTVR
jgi:hypothetical protein